MVAVAVLRAADAVLSAPAGSKEGERGIEASCGAGVDADGFDPEPTRGLSSRPSAHSASKPGEGGYSVPASQEPFYAGRASNPGS